MSLSYPVANTAPEPVSILGIQLHCVNVDAVHSFVSKTIHEGTKALVLNLNIHCANLATKDPWLKEFLNGSQLTFCDGDGVRWGLKLLGIHPPPKITYDRWLWQLGEYCEAKGHSFYFLGGKPGVAKEAATNLLKKYPQLQIAGVHDGYFEKKGAESDRMVETINRLKPDILIVGFGMPVQEKWLSENWRALDAHIFLTAGAAFDYAAGHAKHTPEWVVRLQLEWFYRLCQEPRRLFKRYIFGNPYFFYQILKEKMRRKS